MLIEITLEDETWLRADLIDDDQKVKNLYHTRFIPANGIIQQYGFASNYVRMNHPDLKKIRIVTDIGIHTTTI